MTLPVRRPIQVPVALIVVACAALAALARALRRAVASAAEVPLSPLVGGRRVGADYPERRGVVSDGAVAGEMDDLSAFARPGFDPDAVAPAVRDFYERTADYELAYAVHWHRPFRLGAALASKSTSRLEQLNLPGPCDSGVRRLDSRFVPVTSTADLRQGARAWVRTKPDGAAVFVAIYAHHERGGTRYVNIAVPLPGGNLSTVLRPDNLGGGLELTTFEGQRDERGEGRTDEGLYLVTPLGPVELPLDQRFRVRPADSADGDSLATLGVAVAPNDGPGGASVVATHEMWLFGCQFLTIRYAGRAASP